MNLRTVEIEGVYLIELERKEDERGFFARAWEPKGLKNAGLETNIAQINISYNQRIGTLRGMHWQTQPSEEVKIVRCTRGAIYDVVVDLRPDSRSYGKWFGIKLDAEEYQSIYIPKKFAHGFQTLQDYSEVLYLHSEDYNPKLSRGFRYNDPTFNINWPLPVSIITAKDLQWPDFELKTEGIQSGVENE